jgi:phosphoribosylformylglycinamidine cyclo-ligase
MLSTFNCGIGLVAAVSPDQAETVIAAFRDSGEQAFIIGQLIANEGSESKVRFGGQLG